MMAYSLGVPPLEQGVDVRYVLPGDVASSSSPSRFVTVLGSCVAVCLYDSITGIGGINHYLLPGAPMQPEGNPWRWSDASIQELMRQVVERGATVRRLKAKVFGGAQIAPRNVHCGFKIGERNVEYALTSLQQRGIDVIARCIGGHAGRKVVFESHTGNAWVKNLRDQHA
jgi:chemotaxis protein CheD